MWWGTLLLLLPTLALGQDDPTSPSPCCAKKLVGPDVYIFKETSHATADFNCMDPCVYTLQGTDRKFCFADGTEQVECISSQVKPAAMNRMVFIEGFNEVSLVSLDGKSPNCNLETHPTASAGWPTAVAYKDGAILMCGKLDEESVGCSKFDGSTWSPLLKATNDPCVDSTKSIVANNGWWLIGRKAPCGAKDTTSQFFTGEKWIPGPEFPYNLDVLGEHGLQGFCLVNLSPTETMLIGGNIGRYGRREVYIYNWTNGNWTQAASTLTRFSGQGCVNLGDLGVLIAAGINGVYGDSNNRVELYNPGDDSWSQQPILPGGTSPFEPKWNFLKNPTLLNWDGNAIGLFTDENQIYKWNQGNGNWTVLEGVQLPKKYSGRCRGVMVPDDMVFTCKPV